MEKHNLNENIRVHLTEVGKTIYREELKHQKTDLDKMIDESRATKKKELLASCNDAIAKIDQDQWFTFQLYDFMRIFGLACVMGMPNVVTDAEIFFVKNE